MRSNQSTVFHKWLIKPVGNLVWESNTNLENSNTKHKRSSKDVGLTVPSVFIVSRDVFVDHG